MPTTETAPKPRYPFNHAWGENVDPIGPLNGDTWRGMMRMCDRWVLPAADVEPCWNEVWAAQNDADVEWARTMWWCDCPRCARTDEPR